jgi:ATP-dependent Clp protease ATP-binding subunit ClpC
MFERFAAPTRRVMVEAQNEARELGHHFIATHHLVLGLLVPEFGVTSPVRDLLLAAGMTLDQARGAVLQAEPRRASAPIIGTIPLSPRSKKVLDIAFRESLTRGAAEIGPEHLLVAILRESGGSGCKLLHAYGITLTGVQDWLAGSVRAMADAFPFAPGAVRRPLRRMTPGMERVTAAAERAAGGVEVPIGTQHVLLGLLDEPDGAAARVLAALGVTRDAVEAKVAELGTAGTSDGPPAPPAHVAKDGESVQVRIDDPELARLLESAGDDAVGDIVRRALLDHLKPPA